MAAFVFVYLSYCTFHKIVRIEQVRSSYNNEMQMSPQRLKSVPLRYVNNSLTLLISQSDKETEHGEIARMQSIMT